MVRRAFLAAVVVVAGLPAQGATPSTPSTPPTKAGKAGTTAAHKSRFPIGGMTAGARDYYADVYGVDDLSAQLTDSGALVRFSYHIVDAAKAQPMQDRAANPNLLDRASHAVLSIPVMDKVGPLRQSMTAKKGMTYWMTFSNKGGLVRAGHQVSVVIGPVRIDGLIVQ